MLASHSQRLAACAENGGRRHIGAPDSAKLARRLDDIFAVVEYQEGLLLLPGHPASREWRRPPPPAGSLCCQLSTRALATGHSANFTSDSAVLPSRFFKGAARPIRSETAAGSLTRPVPELRGENVPLAPSSGSLWAFKARGQSICVSTERSRSGITKVSPVCEKVS